MIKPSQANTAWLQRAPQPAPLFDSPFTRPFSSPFSLFYLFGGMVEVKEEEEDEKTTFWLWLLTYIGRFVVVVAAAAAASIEKNQRRTGADLPRRSQPCNAADGCRAAGEEGDKLGGLLSGSVLRSHTTLPTSINSRTNTPVSSPPGGGDTNK